jgi:EmrB/QacA subfamily drug resistance transporter
MSGNVVTETLPLAARGLDRRAVTAALMLVMVLASMEQTITSTAMVTIIGDLHGFQHYAWVASIYLLCCTVTMPLYGRLADVLGRKKVILFAILLFTVSSVLAASARSMLQLICFRGLQGLGAGGIMPLVLTILGDIFTLQERAKIQGLFSAVWGTSSLVGPALGAFLVKTLGWRWIFLVNLPFGLLGLGVLIWKYHDREKPHSTDLDLPGVLLLGIGCMAMLSALSLFGSDSWSWQTGVILITVTLVAFICFILRERSAANPIFSLPLIMNPNIGPALVGTMLLGVCIFGLDTYVPLYVQGGLDRGVTAAAGVVTPVMLTWALSGVVAAPLIIRWGFRKTAMCGACLVVLGFSGQLYCAWFHSASWKLTAVLAITGFGFGPASMSYILAAQDAVEWQQRGVVTGAVQFFRTIGGALGIGVLGALFNVLIQPRLHELHRLGVSSQALLNPSLRDRLDPKTIASIGTLIANGLFWVFVSMLGFAVLTLIFSSMMSRRRADHAVTVTEAMEAVAG